MCARARACMAWYGIARVVLSATSSLVSETQKSAMQPLHGVCMVVFLGEIFLGEEGRAHAPVACGPGPVGGERKRSGRDFGQLLGSARFVFNSARQGKAGVVSVWSARSIA